MQTIKVMKLTSGDTIVANVRPHKKEEYIIIEDPVQFIMSYSDNIGRLVASSWLQTEETIFEIEKSNVVASANPNSMLLEYYSHSLEEIQQQNDYDESLEELLIEYGSETIH